MATGPAVVDDREQLAALTHPTRLRILDALRAPDSAAGVARRLGEPRQRVNHHVRELVKAGLLVPAGERRKGNFVEQLYESVGGTFLVSPRLTWGGGARLRAIADQVSLHRLVDVGERLQRDAAALLDRAAFDGADIPSAAVEASIHFADAAARAEFVDDYLAAVAALVEKYAAAGGDEYSVTFVVHPKPEGA